jgi:hypothetical protein
MVAPRGSVVAVVVAALLGVLTPGLVPMQDRGTARADLISFYGDERVGTSGGQFLRIPAGARSIAMGGGMTATVTGASAVYWNPAAMSTIPTGGRFFVSHMAYVADIGIDHVSYVRRFRSWQIGFSGGVLNSGEIERTTEFHPDGVGQTFRANQFMGGLSVGRQITDRFSFAGTVKMLQENLDEYENRGVFLDLGALYYVGYNRARIGFAIRNFGGDLRLNGSPPPEEGASLDWQSFPAPTVAVFGFAYDVGHRKSQVLTMSLDFSHPSDEAESLIWGAELGFWDRLYLRGGYRNNVVDGGFSTGFGLRLLEGTKTTRFGYAFDARGPFGNINIFSLEIGK